MAYPSSASPWVSVPRITILVVSFFVALGSGTNYVRPFFLFESPYRIDFDLFLLKVYSGAFSVFCFLFFVFLFYFLRMELFS